MITRAIDYGGSRYVQNARMPLTSTRRHGAIPHKTDIFSLFVGSHTVRIFAWFHTTPSSRVPASRCMTQRHLSGASQVSLHRKNKIKLPILKMVLKMLYQKSTHCLYHLNRLAFTLRSSSWETYKISPRVFSFTRFRRGGSFCITVTCYMPCPSHTPWFTYVISIWKIVKIAQLFITLFSPSSSHFIFLGSKYFLHNAVLKYTQYKFGPKGGRPSFGLTKIMCNYMFVCFVLYFLKRKG